MLHSLLYCFGDEAAQKVHATLATNATATATPKPKYLSPSRGEPDSKRASNRRVNFELDTILLKETTFK